jgi:hypothetical protein
MSAQTIFVVTFTVVVTFLLSWLIFSWKKRNPELYKNRNAFVQFLFLFVDFFRTLF